MGASGSGSDFSPWAEVNWAYKKIHPDSDPNPDWKVHSEPAFRLMTAAMQNGVRRSLNDRRRKVPH
jgi:hypothetical protein